MKAIFYSTKNFETTYLQEANNNNFDINWCTQPLSLQTTILAKGYDLACISSNEEIAQRIIRKAARLASYYNSKWFVLYVQTPKEAADKIPLDKQRHLINTFKNATELGAEVIQRKGNNIASEIIETVNERGITTLCLGKPHLNLFQVILQTSVFNQLLKTLSKNNIDIVILS